MNEPGRAHKRRYIVELIVAPTLMAIVTLTTHAIIGVMDISLWPLSDAEYPLSAWPWVLPPAIAIVALYPVFIANSGFRRPVSRKPIVDQALFGIVFLPALTMVIQLIIVAPVQFIHSGTLLPISLGVALLWPTTVIAVVLGVFSSLSLYHLHDRIQYEVSE